MWEKYRLTWETYHWLIAIACVQFHVDLAIDSGLTFGMVVLTALTDSHFVSFKLFGLVLTVKETETQSSQLSKAYLPVRSLTQQRKYSYARKLPIRGLYTLLWRSKSNVKDEWGSAGVALCLCCTE